MDHPDGGAFEAAWNSASAQLSVRPASDIDSGARLSLWRAQEFHNWLRWKICRKGFDWSKPGVILLNAIGFAALVFYGFQTGRFYITAGGIVAWFTCVNLSFFTYFGLTLPGPPLTLPEPVAEKGERFRAEMGLYPAGYERRKFARVWLRVQSMEGTASRFEMAMQEFPSDLMGLLEAQKMWRMQRGDAPLTDTVIESTGVSREQLDAGEMPFRIVAWRWDEKALTPFDRRK